jgi:hypothetical protein
VLLLALLAVLAAPAAASATVNNFLTGYAGAPTIGSNYSASVYNNYWTDVEATHAPNQGVYRIDVYYGVANGYDPANDGFSSQCITGDWGVAPCSPNNWGRAMSEYIAATQKTTSKILITLRQGVPDNLNYVNKWPTHTTAWANFASAVATAFPLANIVEIGNEVNYHANALTPQAYVSYVNAAFNALPARVSTVLVGSLNGAGGSSDAVLYVSALDKIWFNGLSAANKARVALSVHPYLHTPSSCAAPAVGSGARNPPIDALKSFLATIANQNTVIGPPETLGPTGIWTGPVWISEFDYQHLGQWDDPTACPHNTVAANITALFPYLRGIPQIKAVVWYELVDIATWYGGLTVPYGPSPGDGPCTGTNPPPWNPRDYCTDGGGNIETGWSPGGLPVSSTNNPFWAWVLGATGNAWHPMKPEAVALTLTSGTAPSNGETSPTVNFQYQISNEPLTSWTCTFDLHPYTCNDPTNIAVSPVVSGNHTFALTVTNASGSQTYNTQWAGGQHAPSAVVASSDIVNGATHPDFHISLTIANEPLTTWSCTLDGLAESCPDPHSITLPGLSYSGHDFTIHLQNQGGSWDMSPHITWTGGQPAPTIAIAGGNIANGSTLSVFHMDFSIGNAPLTNWACYLDGVQFSCPNPSSVDIGPVAYGPHDFVLIVWNYGGAASIEPTWVGGG